LLQHEQNNDSKYKISIRSVVIEQADYEIFWLEGHGGNWRVNKLVIDLLQDCGIIFTKEEIEG
jgi:hypothetical protein